MLYKVVKQARTPQHFDEYTVYKYTSTHPVQIIIMNLLDMWEGRVSIERMRWLLVLDVNGRRKEQNFSHIREQSTYRLHNLQVELCKGHNIKLSLRR